MSVRVLLAAIFAAASMACAQTSTATLSGVVLDLQEGVIASAAVTIQDPGRGFQRKTISNSSGASLFTHIAPTT